jgi:hypothetical protein
MKDRPKKERVAICRRRLAIVTTVLGIFLFAAAEFQYRRYVTSGLHVAERLQYAATLRTLWCVCFYGSMPFGILSLFGVGWGRWSGFVANGAAFLSSLMSLGAMCGPFGC